MSQDPTLGDLDPGSALDHNQLARPDGVLATSGSPDCRVSVDSGALGADDTLAVEPGQIRIGGTVVEIPAQPVGVPAVGDQPRKDLVVGNGDGTATIEEGTPETPQYSRLIPEAERVLAKAYRPTPPDAATLDGVVLAVVLVVPDTGDTLTDSVSTGEEGPVADRRSFVLGERVDSQVVNNTVYAGSMPGDDLSAKVVNALDVIQSRYGGQGRVRITPKNDGTHWQWTQDVTIDPFGFESVEIEAESNTYIEYTGTGVAITADAGGEFDNDRKQLTITGGMWVGTNSPQGWFRGIDVCNCHIAPQWVDMGYGNGDGSFGVQFRNRARWCEMNTIEAGYISADYPIDYVGAAFNPNAVESGTGSFQGNQIQGGNLHCGIAAIRCRGNFQYSHFRSPQLFLFGDGSSGFHFESGDDHNWGLTIVGAKTEEHASDTSSFSLGAGFDGFYDFPTILGGWFEQPTNMVTADAGANNAKLPHVVAGKNALEVRTYTPDGIRSSAFYDNGTGHELDVDEVKAQADSLTLSDVGDLSGGATGGASLESFEGGGLSIVENALTANVFSGDYSDLTNKPDLFDADDARSAVDGADVDIGGDADTVDGLDFQVGGSEPADDTTVWFDTGDSS